MSEIAWGLSTPRPEPMGEPAGITLAHPSSSSRTQSRGSSEQ